MPTYCYGQILAGIIGALRFKGNQTVCTRDEMVSWDDPRETNLRHYTEWEFLSALIPVFGVLELILTNKFDFLGGEFLITYVTFKLNSCAYF